MKKIGIAGIACLALFLVSCGDNASKGSSEGDDKKVESNEQHGSLVAENTGVCIWDKGSVRASSGKDGKYLSALSLGESVEYLGKTEVDETDKHSQEYHQIKLSDGTTGWASEYVVMINAKPAAVKNKAVIFKRPDAITMTEGSFSPLSFVAVTEEIDGFVKVTGNQRKSSGWIQTSDLSFDTKDVAVAVLFTKNDLSLEKSDVTQLTGFIESNPFKDAAIVGQIEDRLQELQQMVTEEIQPEESVDLETSMVETDSI